MAFAELLLFLLIFIFFEVLFLELFARSALRDVDVVTPAVLMVPRVAGGALGDVVFICGTILAMAEGVLVSLLVTEDTDERGLGIGIAVLIWTLDRHFGG